MNDLILERKSEITISTGQIMVFTVNCTDKPMLSADGLWCLSTPPTNTSTSTFFSFDFLAGVVRTAATPVTEPLCHQTSLDIRQAGLRVEENQFSAEVAKQTPRRAAQASGQTDKDWIGMCGVVDTAGLKEDHVSLQRSHPCAVPSPCPCPHGGRASWPSLTEPGAVLHPRYHRGCPFFP